MRNLVIMSALLVLVSACQGSGTDSGGQEKGATPEPSGALAPEGALEVAEVSPAVGSKPMLPAYKLPGDLKPNKADEYGDYKTGQPNVYGITNPPTVGVRPVAEYENADRIMITVSDTGLPAGIWSNLVDVVKYSKPVAAVHVIYDQASVKTAFGNALTAAGIANNAVTWVNLTNDSIWVRDYGPLPIMSDGGKVGIVDLRYYHQRVYDDAIPTKLGSLWNVTVYRAPIDFEGGNFMSDSKGNCFASEGLLYYNAVDEATVKEYMKNYVGCKNTYITTPMQGEGTTHIDMAAKITDDNTIIVGKYTQAQDATNMKVLDNNAAYLQSLGYTVVRMPMPSNKDGNFRTYTNSLFINGVNLVPVYSIDKAIQADAMAVWEQVMPTWNHVELNSDDVITWAGATHCITMTTGKGTFSPIEAAPGFACNGDWSCNPGSTTPTGCGNITYQGCCEGQLLKWCENNKVQTQNCGNDPQCGWDAGNKWYSCGTNGGADPSGKYPKACDGTCTPSCTGKECGDDGCGGSCGTCAQGKICSQGKCVQSSGPAQCLGPNQPSGDACGAINDIGCCDEAGRVLYCQGGKLYCIDCAQGGSQCGWDTQASFYNCGTNAAADPSGQNPKACGGTCQPNCAGKECGPDGCGGTCGTCAAGKTCNAAGKCQSGACIPSCTGKQCGPDGCGGTCGTCPAGQACNAQGLCQNACIPNCTGKVCGDDGCGGICGTCKQGEMCQQGKCVVVADPCLGISWEGCCNGSALHYCNEGALETLECGATGCGWNAGKKYYDCQQAGADPSGTNPIACPPGVCIPNCANKQCGDDGCGGSCGTCIAGTQCTNGICLGQGGCGDVTYGGKCEGNVLLWCEAGNLQQYDCSTLPGNFKCGFAEPPDKEAGYYCVEQPPCEPDCTGKACGDDGCGGSCGTCPAGKTCKDGVCVDGPCQPDCVGKACGGDGCGGSCGTCANALDSCVAGKCVCTPQCQGVECGPDGCGGSCGGCPAGFTCNDGACAQGCQPDCAGKACGDDGCGGSCGSCPAGQFCTAGKCSPECVPDCTGKACGPDGCSGSCGTCPKGYSCDHAACVEDQEGPGCGNITTTGQCQGAILQKCVSGQVVTVDCALTGKVCSFVPTSGMFDCVTQCIPVCAGKTCGDDGCGGSCGVCVKGQTCNAGKCVELCQPDCAGRVCGSDLCGGQCGECAAGLTCNGQGQCVQESGPDVVPTDDVAAQPEEEAPPHAESSDGCTTGRSASHEACLVLAGLLLALAATRRFSLIGR